jgi:exonuclease III
MAMSLSINRKMLCILNVYAPAKGSSRVDEWIDKCLWPVVDEILLQGWGLIAGGDFNAAPHPIDYGRPEHYKVCPALLGLLSDNLLVDSFWLANPDTIDFSWTRLAKKQYLGT